MYILVRKMLKEVLRKYYNYKITREELRRMLRSGVLGKVTGVIGPFVVRYWKGRMIISNRPEYFHLCMSEAAVQSRNRFAAKVKFAKIINNDPLLRRIWTRSNMEGQSSWTKLLKRNDISGIAPTAVNTITPDDYSFTSEHSCTLDNECRIRINNSGNYDHLYILLVPFEPKDSKAEQFKIMKFNISAGVSELELNEEQKELCRAYNKYIIYCASLRISGNEIKWSNTVVSEGSIPVAYSESAASVLIWILDVEQPSGCCLILMATPERGYIFTDDLAPPHAFVISIIHNISFFRKFCNLRS